MKNRKIIYIISVLILLAVLGFGAYKTLSFAMDKYHYLRNELVSLKNETERRGSDYVFHYDWMQDNVLVAHAFGGKGTKTYTNALEAFEYNYGIGHNVFEVDFDLTADDQTICSHDEDYWRYITGNEDSDLEYSYENFKKTPLFKDYTPLDYKDIIDLLIEYQDIYIITDTKYCDEVSIYKQFSQLTDYAKEKDPEVLKRIVPQIYTMEMLDYLMNVYPFDSVIFTLYQIQWEAEDIAKFCMRNGIRFITVSAEAVEDEDIALWKSMGIHVAVHTLDDKKEADSFLKKGVEMIYTDFLTPEQFYSEGD
ncbi:MAG: hypothetical protein K5648_04770 [Erysipelotrichaceae bacterium]|nr:hypothetical protein [Erysipelotrichaceae bacterium]